MKTSDIDRFFLALDKQATSPLVILITGGAAALLYGGRRATQDIDFEVGFKIGSKKSKNLWPQIQAWLKDVSQSTGISPEYSDNIDRWSMIVLPHKKSRLYKKFGKVEVRLLDPSLWAIGKLTRYLGTDLQDLVEIFSRIKFSPLTLARLWGRALALSPPSPSQFEFRQHVEHFFDSQGSLLWGKKVNLPLLKRRFLQSAL